MGTMESPWNGSASPGAELCRPRSSQTVSVSVTDDLSLEVQQCIETKTVTTTTTTKRRFPPCFKRQPRPLETLDTKEYPLALIATPPEIANFEHHVAGGDEEDYRMTGALDAKRVRFCLGVGRG